MTGVASLVVCLLAAQGVSSSEAVRVLGRCPVDSVVAVQRGKFVTADIDDLLVLQRFGRVELSRGRGGARGTVSLGRLALLRHGAGSFATVWQSPAFVIGASAGLDIVATAWTSADFDGDGRLEIAMVNGDTARLVSFDGDTVSIRSAPFPGTGVEQAAGWADDSSGSACLVTIERFAVGADSAGYVVAAYSHDSTGWRESFPPLGLGIDAGTRPLLCGSARFADYYYPMPVLGFEAAELRPSTYACIEKLGPGEWRLTGDPFPTQEWFSKTRALPAGRLDLFNVGDTLLARGYFVPGARPDGQSASFAALDDGEWRVLQFAEAAPRLSGPACRFTLAGADGWLEVRDGLIHFYPGDVFHWR